MRVTAPAAAGRGDALVRRDLAFAANSGRPILYLVALLPLALVVGLVAIILWTSVATDLSAGWGASLTLRSYAALLADPLVSTALANTAGFTGVTVAVAMSFGVAVAWLVERTDLPGKQLVYALMTGVLLFPSIFLAMGWMFLLHPRIGVLNTWLMRVFHLGAAPISIANIAGMGWVEGLGLASLAFVILSPVLRALDGALDDAATVHGSGRWSNFVHITLPLTVPALLAAAIYIVVIAVATFEVPAVIGLGNKIYTFSTLVYIKVVPETGVPQYGVVGAVSVVLIATSLLLGWWYFRVIRLSHRYAVVTGRSNGPRLLTLGSMRWLGYALLGAYFTLSFLLPLVMLIWAALLPYIQPFSLAALQHLTLHNFDRLQWGLLWRSAGHTLILMATVPTLALVFGLAISWVVVRSHAPGRFLVDYVAFLPHAIPNLIFAIAMMIVALDIVPKGVSFYGTIYILMAVYVLVRISLVTRVLNAALLQIHAELEEAAHMSGHKTFATLAWVTVPLLLPAIANLWIWTALLTYRELTMAAFLVTRDNITLPVLVWQNWNSGDGGRAAAISLVCIALFFPMIAVYWGFRARVRVGEPRA